MRTKDTSDTHGLAVAPGQLTARVQHHPIPRAPVPITPLVSPDHPHLALGLRDMSSLPCPLLSKASTEP